MIPPMLPAAATPLPTFTPAPGSAWQVFLVFLRLGLTSFGGPIAHLGYFRAELVDRRRWLDDARYSDIVALCQFLPGPASSQVGIAIGMARAGWLGSLAAWVGFTLPSAILLVAFGYGISRFASIADMSLEDWHAVIETNVNGVFYCTRHAIPQMKARGGGYIFNVSSLAGRNAFPTAGAYCASKHAVNGFSEVLFQELRDDGIRVTYLMPGSVATEFGRGTAMGQDWALQAEDVGEMVVDLLHTHPRALHSRVEMRPARPPRKG